jgi:hypothetical protein
VEVKGMGTLIEIMAAIVWVGLFFCCLFLADKKGRRKENWGFAAFFLPIPTILILLFVKPRNMQEDLD